MLKLTNISFGFTDQPLYKNVNITISEGQKIGIVGPNGAGKSTLLKLILGLDTPTSGKIEKTGTTAYVPQEIKHDKTMDEAQNVRDYADPWHSYKDHELLKFFSSLELSISLDANPQKFSGGQKTKLALARALLSHPDILLLDEPTNFMDIEGTKWVMNFLSNYKGCVLVISHDLALMDRSTDKILSINPHLKTIEEYKGNYTTYLKLKEEKDELLRKTRLVQIQHIKRMEKGLAKMARANRFTGAKIKQIHRIEAAKEALPDAPPEIRKITIKLPEPLRIGELPIRATHLSKSYGEKKVLKDVSLTIRRGDRIALIGPNGVGKSTFIKILMKRLTSDSGDVVYDESLDIGYYSQEFETFNLEKSVIDVFCELTKQNEGFGRAFLGRYMLSGDKVFQAVKTLSGGEKTRLSIAALTGKNHNLLILDEPTTYLDVLSQRIILEALKEYKGTMLIVSHTPEFLVELKPNRAYLFPEEKEVYWDDSLVSKASEI